jgi:hypothetical protein
MGGTPLPYFLAKYSFLMTYLFASLQIPPDKELVGKFFSIKDLAFSEGLHSVFLLYFQYRGLEAWNRTGVTCMDTVGWMDWGLDKAFLVFLSIRAQTSVEMALFVGEERTTAASGNKKKSQIHDGPGSLVLDALATTFTGCDRGRGRRRGRRGRAG